MAAGFAGVTRGAAALAGFVVAGGAVMAVTDAHTGRAVETFRTVWMDREFLPLISFLQ